MKKFIKLIKEKWLKQTSLTIALVAIILCMFIVINAVFQNIDIQPLDFTQQKMFSLSDESKEQVKKVEQNVTVYFFGYTDESSAVVLGKQYHNVNEKIDVQVVNASERPDLAAEYGITGSDQLVAVASSQRYKAIAPNEMYTYDQTSAETIDITEQKLTNAILDVTIISKPKVYFLKGHGEYGVASAQDFYYTLGQYIVNDVNDVDGLDLLSSEIPETCDVLVIANPTKDFTDVEKSKIDTYINNGGKIIWLQDPYININKYDSNNFKNINSILDEFGISFSKGIVYEQDPDRVVDGYPDLIVPDLEYNEIVKDLYTDANVVLTGAGRINTADSEKLNELNVTAQAFMKSSNKSYYKEKFDTVESMRGKTNDDEEGPFVLGETLTKKINDEKSAKLIAYSSALFVSNAVIPIANSNLVPIALRDNKDLVLNSVAYLTNREDAIRIRKDTGVVSFETATASQATIVRLIIFAVPILIIVAGIVVVIVRRRRK